MGHIHIGYKFKNEDEIINFVKAFDYYVVLPALEMDPDTIRRKHYGRAGSFRIKDFGVEMRQLSNFWLEDREKMKWVFEKTHEAFNNRFENFEELNIESKINNYETEKIWR